MLFNHLGSWFALCFGLWFGLWSSFFDLACHGSRHFTFKYLFFILRLDSKTLLQRYNPLQGDAGEYLHKSANLFTGFVPASRDKYVSVAVKFVNVDSNSYTVRVIKRGTAEDP